jgi:ParB family chromosome partitioning protein
MYGLSSRTVARYQRIYQLINELKIRLDNGVIAFIPAVTLSFLKESEQQELARCAEINKFSIDMKKADMLRAFSEKGKLDDERIYLILNGEIGKKPKPNRTPTVKVRKDVYAKYFKPNQPAREVEEIVEKALELYFQQGI